MLTARWESRTDLLVNARVAYRGGDWETSYTAFSRAGAVGPLSLDDLDAMADAAWRLGHEREAVRIAALVFGRLTRTDPSAAATKAVALGAAWLMRGDAHVGRSWMQRARGLLGSVPRTVAGGYLVYLDSVVAALTEDGDVLAERSATLRQLAGQLDVPALTSLSMAAEGLSALVARCGQDADRLLDEAIARLVGEPPAWTGEIFYVTLYHCRGTAEPVRFGGWTSSLDRLAQAVSVSEERLARRLAAIRSWPRAGRAPK